MSSPGQGDPDQGVQRSGGELPKQTQRPWLPVWHDWCLIRGNIMSHSITTQEMRADGVQTDNLCGGFPIYFFR